NIKRNLLAPEKSHLLQRSVFVKSEIPLRQLRDIAAGAVTYKNRYVDQSSVELYDLTLIVRRRTPVRLATLGRTRDRGASRIVRIRRPVERGLVAATSLGIF